MGNNLAEAVSDQHHIHDFSNGNAGHQHPLQSPNTDATLSQDDKRIPEAESGSILMIKPSIKSVPSNLHLNTNITPPTATTTTSARLPLPSLSLPPVPSLPSPISPLTSPIPTHFPTPPDPVGFGNAGLAILRVWWEEPAEYPFDSHPLAGAGAATSGGLQARGRVEMWGEVGHLQDGSSDEDDDDDEPDDGLQDEDEGVQGDV